MIQSSSLMITTGFGLYFALKRQFTYHRQWMIRSYAVALTFSEVRVIVGVFGLDQPFDWHILETVVWSCVASSVLIGDIANQLYGHLTPRTATARAGDNVGPSDGVRCGTVNPAKAWTQSGPRLHGDPAWVPAPAFARAGLAREWQQGSRSVCRMMRLFSLRA